MSTATAADALEQAPTVVTTASAATNDRPSDDTVRPAGIMDFPGASANLPDTPVPGHRTEPPDETGASGDGSGQAR